MTSRRASQIVGIAARWAVPLVAATALLAPMSAQAAVNPVLTGWVSSPTLLPDVDSVAVAGHYAYVTDYFAGRLARSTSPFLPLRSSRGRARRAAN